MSTPYILVAEDDLDAVLLLQCALREAGPEARVHFVGDGQQALDVLQGKQGEPPRPGLLLLDLKMPVVNGFAVLEFLGQCPALRPAWVVACSTSSLAEDIEYARQLGADYYIVKPVDYDTLVHITRWLVTLVYAGVRTIPARCQQHVRPLGRGAES